MVLGVGSVGSLVDVATLLLVVVQLGIVVRNRQESIAAALVALARGRDDVDDARIQADLDVVDRDVDQYLRLVVCGGESASDS